MSRTGFDPTISLIVHSETLRFETSARDEPLTCCFVQSVVLYTICHSKVHHLTENGQVCLVMCVGSGRKTSDTLNLTQNIH
jgi:hypothetical protein